MNKTICEIIRQNEQNYITGITTISKYVQFDMWENINKIEAYLNSKHVSGESDSLGREKPFFDIGTAACNIWYRATDIDRKDIRIKATKSSDIFLAFLATIHLQDYMRNDNFGVFLNDWGLSLARYGSSVLKFIESEGKLHAMVMAWNRLIVDPVDFDSNPVIEVLELTPAQLKKRKGYDQEMVEGLLQTVTSRTLMDKQKVDNRNDFIKLYEIHGELPLSLLTDDENDSNTYVQQMHVVSFVAKKDGGYDDFTLVKGKETISPYMITHLIKEDGRTMAIGAIEHLFQAQWMQNHTVKAIKDQLDLASKLIFQTSDGNFVGQNALSAIENGDILVHNNGEPLTQLANNSHDIGSLQSFGNQWKALAQEITSTPDVLSGTTLPSGTAYRQAAILQQESHSLFEIMTENKGLSIEEMMRKFIIPHIKKQMDTTDEIEATLDAQKLVQIDSVYVPNEAIRRSNNSIKESILNGEIAEQPDLQSLQQEVKGELQKQGNQRFFKPSDISDKTWKELFKDIEWNLEVEVTNEQSNKEVVLSTLNTVLQTVATNPAVLNDPNMKMLFSKILETTGAVSSVELSTIQNQPVVSSIKPEEKTSQVEA